MENEHVIDSLGILLQNTRQICSHTDSWHHSATLNIIFGILSVVATVATILGLLAIISEWWKVHRSRGCQRLILQDMIRHLYVNHALTEIVRIKMEGKYATHHPEKGVFSRFVFLPEDTDVGRFSMTSRNFDRIHSLGLSLRNYNIACDAAEKHFGKKKVSEQEKKHDLDVLTSRAVGLERRILRLADMLGLDIEPLDNVVEDKYASEIANKDKGEPEALPTRDGDRGHFDEKYGLQDLTDGYIRMRFDEIKLFEFNNSPDDK